MSRGKELAEQGYKQVSSKYRMVGKLPDGMTGIQALATVDPELAKRMQQTADASAEHQYLRVYDKATLKLTEEEFQDFKKAGGSTV